MKDLINRELEQVAKETLNLHSFIYESLLKKKEIPHELSGHALLNNANRILGDCIYTDTDSVKERN